MNENDVHQRGYWLVPDEHFFDEALARELCSLFGGSCVLDVGCGSGRYVAHMRQQGIEAFGVDGSEFIVGTPFCSRVDLSEKDALRHLGQFESVLCLEVGEHIPAAFESAFLDSLVGAASENAVIVLSWAVVGQGGTGHVNERQNEYVIGEMGNRGCGFDSEATSHVRAACTLRWFQGSLMMFNKTHS